MVLPPLSGRGEGIRPDGSKWSGRGPGARGETAIDQVQAANRLERNGARIARRGSILVSRPIRKPEGPDDVAEVVPADESPFVESPCCFEPEEPFGRIGFAGKVRSHGRRSKAEGRQRAARMSE